MRLPSRPSAALALCIALGVAGSVRADEQRALGLALFEEARKLSAEGKHKEACPKFEEAFGLIGGVGVAFNLADCWEQTGRIASAWGMFGKAAVLAREKKDAERAKLSTEREQALEPRLPKLTVRASVETPGLEVTVGKLRLGAGSLGTKFPVDPGTVSVEAKAPGRSGWVESVTLAEKQELEVVIPELKAAPPPAPTASASASASSSAPPPPSGEPPQRTAGIAVGAGGLGLLALGGVLGGVALARYEDSVAAGCDALSRCVPAAANIRNEGRALGDASTVFFVLGAAALAAGIVVFVTAPKPAARPSVSLFVSPTGLGGTLP